MGLPHASPLMVWLTTAWKIDADRSGFIALVYQRLDMDGKYATPGCNQVDSLVILAYSLRYHRF